MLLAWVSNRSRLLSYFIHNSMFETLYLIQDGDAPATKPKLKKQQTPTTIETNKKFSMLQVRRRSEENFKLP